MFGYLEKKAAKFSINDLSECLQKLESLKIEKKKICATNIAEILLQGEIFHQLKGHDYFEFAKNLAKKNRSLMDGTVEYCESYIPYSFFTAISRPDLKVYDTALHDILVFIGSFAPTDLNFSIVQSLEISYPTNPSIKKYRSIIEIIHNRPKKNSELAEKRKRRIQEELEERRKQAESRKQEEASTQEELRKQKERNISELKTDQIDLYEIAGNEIEDGTYQKGLWVKAFADADGDETKQKVLYIKYRVKQLEELRKQEELEERRRQEELKRQEEPKRRRRQEEQRKQKNSELAEKRKRRIQEELEERRRQGARRREELRRQEEELKRQEELRRRRRQEEQKEKEELKRKQEELEEQRQQEKLKRQEELEGLKRQEERRRGQKEEEEEELRKQEDLKKRAELEGYIEAAESGDAEGQNNLGVMYETGRGVTKDLIKAVHWYRKGAAQGLADAQTNLGVKYEFGKGVAPDSKKAIEWYTRAAEQGDTDAQENLQRIERKERN